MVPPKAFSPAISIATTSAWLWPAGCVLPCPTVMPSLVIIAPTEGLGLVVPQPSRASFNASCIGSKIVLILFPYIFCGLLFSEVLVESAGSWVGLALIFAA